mgnify:CR=1 FL=1
MKKFTAMLLAVVMVFALGASAFAADTGDTYSSYTFTDLGLTLQVSNGTEGLKITGSGLSATISPDGSNEMPQSLSLIFSNSDGSDFDTASVSVTADHAAIFGFYTEGQQNPKYGYGIVELNGDSTSLTIRRSGKQCLVNINAPTAQVAGTGLVAFLPAPGQFVNEGANGSGWGGPFTASGASTLKNLVEGYVTTGISLGSFGGYAVLDFGAITRDASGAYVSGGIYNDPNNAYGVDFTLFGNAMSTWAEPGCVQVSQDGTNWYTLAGSLHYQTPSTTAGGAIWNYSATYTNPLVNEAATTDGEAVPYTSVYQTRPTSNAATESGTVGINNWHKHHYFPLYNNYFVALNGRTAALDGLLNPIPGLTMTNFGSYTAKTAAAAASLTLNGVRLVAPKTTNGGNSTAPDDYLFGYFDCHPNGLRSGAQVNPYTTGRTGNDNSNGDPMDISWAVEADGTPKYLDAIRYVRVYTGVMQMNGIMGESSSELLGSHKAVTKGTGAASTTPTVKVGTSIVETTNMDVATKKVYSATTKVTVTSSAEKIFVNGAQVSSGTEVTISTPTSSTNYVQIITQSGTESPYITLLKITR